MAVTHRYTMGGANGPDDFEEIGVHSTKDIPQEGVVVRTGPAGLPKEVFSPDQIADGDVITVDGIEMKAEMARSMGLLGDSFYDEPITSNDLAKAATETQQQALQQHQGDVVEGEPNEDVDFNPEADFNGIMDGLNTSIEDGSIPFEEAQKYETIMGALLLEGESPETAAEVIEGLSEGTIDPDDVPQEMKNMLDRVEAQVAEAAKQSVIAELGPEGFEELQAYAERNPHAAAAYSEVAIARALGRNESGTWSDMLEYSRQQNW